MRCGRWSTPPERSSHARPLGGGETDAVREDGVGLTKARGEARWFCYVLECADGTFYTGITGSLEQRLATHKRRRASKYTRGRLPVRLVYAEPHRDRSAASRREIELKKFSREIRRALTCAGG